MAKEFAARIIGDEYIIPTLGVWNHFDDIDFSNLPNQFALNALMIAAAISFVKTNPLLIKTLPKSK